MTIPICAMDPIVSDEADPGKPHFNEESYAI
jgi:hypothetical protein